MTTSSSDRIVELAEIAGRMGCFMSSRRPMANSADFAAGAAAAKEMRAITREILDSSPRARATNSAPQPVPAPAPPAPKAETTALYPWAYALLTFAARARLKTQDLKLYTAMKGANQAQREELTAKLSQTKSMKDRAAIFAEFAKL